MNKILSIIFKILLAFASMAVMFLMLPILIIAGVLFMLHQLGEEILKIIKPIFKKRK